MTTDFLIGAIRASRDLHPNVKTELEEILQSEEKVKPKRIRDLVFCGNCEEELFEGKCIRDRCIRDRFCCRCGRPVDWS